MFSKVKCPNCGAKNAKERMACATCGASLYLGQDEGQLTEVPQEGKPTVMTPTQETQRAHEPTYPTQPTTQSAQRTATGFFGRMVAALRDPTRDTICAGLQALGVDAKMAERDRVEEWFGTESIDSGSLGLIDIADGPIRWVNVRRLRGGLGGGQGSETRYYTDYGVPDSRLEPSCPKPRIKSARKKYLPLIGPVHDLYWKGKDSGLGIIRRLNSDISIKDPIMRSRDVTIRAHGNQRCWIISTEWRSPLSPLSAELWDCYQRIAKHLLTDWSPSK